jgi:hypothetical protein
MHQLHPARQSSAPDPGPTLAVELARGKPLHRVALTVRLTPVANEQQAASAAARLG